MVAKVTPTGRRCVGRLMSDVPVLRPLATHEAGGAFRGVGVGAQEVLSAGMGVVWQSEPLPGMRQVVQLVVGAASAF